MLIWYHEKNWGLSGQSVGGLDCLGSFASRLELWSERTSVADGGTSWCNHGQPIGLADHGAYVSGAR
jgi:hypothetical protein